MRPDHLTERLAFQRNVTTTDSQGGRSSAWATFATIWGALAPLSGHEALQAQAIGSVVQYHGFVPTQQLEAAAVSVSSLTRSGTTATVTTAAAHGLTTGGYVRIAGATQAAYNGKVAVTVTGATTFTYVVAGSPATPATGTITAKMILPISPLLRIAWTPSWDGGQTSKTLAILAVRLDGRDWLAFDCAERI